MGYEETNNIHRPRLENAAKGLLDQWEMYTETGRARMGMDMNALASRGRTIVSGCGLAERDEIDVQLSFDHYHMPPLHYWVSRVRMGVNTELVGGGRARMSENG